VGGFLKWKELEIRCRVASSRGFREAVYLGRSGWDTMFVQGMIFDVEDTFFDGTFWHRYLHRAICRLGDRRSFAEVQAAWQSQFLPEVYQGKRDYWDALASSFRLWGLSQCEVSELLAASQSRMKFAQANLRLFPFVSETLQRFKTRGLKLGVLCNSIHQPLAFAEMLLRMGVRTPMDAILTSRHLGRVLPDAAGFCAISEAMGCGVENLVYVSAREERLEVGHQAGLGVIIRVAKQRMSPTPHIREGHLNTIDNLAGLEEAVLRLETGHGMLARQA
jgi:FMN phosphatase YigB (HAD superfamily)